MVLVDPNVGPQQRGQDLLARAFERGELERGGITAFFDDPQRQVEIDELVDVGLNRALRGLGGQIRQRSLQEAFARSRSGNIGGSFQAGQQAGIQATADIGAADISAGAEGQRFALSQQLQEQKQQELLNSFGIDPFTQQSIQAILRGLNVQGRGNQAQFALDEQRRTQEAFANDELSRAFGNLLNVGGNIFTVQQQSKAAGRRGIV